MKKALIFVLAFAAMMVFAPVNAYAEGIVIRFAVGSTTYNVGGQSGTLDAAPFNADGRVMVPLRQIADAIGAEDVRMEGQTIIVDDIQLEIGVALPNNMGTAVIVDGRTFVPLGFIAQEIGATPRWDGSANAAYIYIGDAPAVVTPAAPEAPADEPAEEEPVAEEPAVEEPAAEEPAAEEPAAVAADWQALMDAGYIIERNLTAGATIEVLPTGIRISNRGGPQDGIGFNVVRLRALTGGDIAITGILFGGYEWSAIGGRADGSQWVEGTSAEQTFTLAAGDAVAANLWNSDNSNYVAIARAAYYDVKITGITVGGQDIFALVN